MTVMLISCVLLIIEVVFFLILSLKRSLLFAVVLKVSGVILCFLSLFLVLSKVSHYKAQIALDKTIFSWLARMNLSIFNILSINNLGIFLFSLSVIFFVVIISKRFFLAGVLSCLTIAIIAFNSNLIRQKLYVFALSKPQDSLWNIDTVTLYFKYTNILFLILVLLIPYIILAFHFIKDNYIYRKKSFFYIALIYIANDIWMVTLFFFTDFRNYFYTNFSLLFYPQSVEIVALNNIIPTVSVLLLLISIVVLNMYIPFKTILIRWLPKLTYNVDDNIYALLHTFKNAFVTISLYVDNTDDLLLPSEKKMNIIKKTCDEQLKNLETSIDGLDFRAMKFKPLECIDVTNCLDDALGRSCINNHIKTTKNYFVHECYVSANMQQLRECFICIINNSVDALCDVKEPKLSITSETYGNNVFIEIRDNGCGIENKQIVFRPLYSTKMGGSNLGMGLTYTKKIIKALHGEIDIKSKKGEYTAIQIVLPIAKQKKPATFNNKISKNIEV